MPKCILIDSSKIHPFALVLLPSTFVTCSFLVRAFSMEGLCHILGNSTKGTRGPPQMGQSGGVSSESSTAKKGKQPFVIKEVRLPQKNPLFRKYWLSLLWRGRLTQRNILVMLGGPDIRTDSWGSFFSNLPQREGSCRSSVCSKFPALSWHCTNCLDVFF